MEKQIIETVLGLINLAIARSSNDPASIAKIQAGEPLDLDDLKRLGVDRDAAGDELDQAINDASGN